MTQENKQITIYELLPLLKPGWVAMDEDGKWYWYGHKPILDDGIDENAWYDSYSEVIEDLDVIMFESPFNVKIKSFDGDWKDSLMEVK